MAILIKNAKYYNDFHDVAENVDVLIENEKIIKICKTNSENFENCEIIDVHGNYILPGLCDIHTHGAIMHNFTFGTVEEICDTMDKHYSANGVTMIYPTTVSAEKKDIENAVKNIKAASKICKSVNIAGIHIEGPYLSMKRRGAHLPELLRLPEIAEIDNLIKIADGLPLRLTIAPELENAIEFIKECKKRGIFITLGHTDANFEILMKAIDAGADCFTHLFNAMSPLHHREPGAVGTALCEDVYTELICDGVHVHPEIIKLTKKIKDKHKVILITDSIQAAGLTNGENKEINLISAGKEVIVKNGIARTKTGELAGSTIGLIDGFVNYIKFTGASIREASLAASENPSKAVKSDEEFGKIDMDRKADFIIYDENSEKLKYTFFNGKITYKAN